MTARPPWWRGRGRGRSRGRGHLPALRVHDGGGARGRPAPAALRRVLVPGAGRRGGAGHGPGGARGGTPGRQGAVPHPVRGEPVMYCTVLYCTVLYCTVLKVIV